MKKIIITVIVALVVIIPLALKRGQVAGREAQPAVGSAQAGQAEARAVAPRAQTGKPAAKAVQPPKALPRFVDLGTTTCAPCKVMLGVMAELKQKYPGAMVVDFVNVQETPEQAQSYGIQYIPTQIFYGPDGAELYRHVGVFPTGAIIAKWAELGFDFNKPSAR